MWCMKVLIMNIYNLCYFYLLKGKSRLTLVYRLAWYTNHFKALRHGSHSLTCMEHHACLYLVSVLQMALSPSPNCSSLLIYRLREDERLSWLGWLTSSGRFTHISGHTSTEGWACNRESSPAKTDVLATVPRHQRILTMLEPLEHSS